MHVVRLQCTLNTVWVSDRARKAQKKEKPSRASFEAAVVSMAKTEGKAVAPSALSEMRWWYVTGRRRCRDGPTTQPCWAMMMAHGMLAPGL